MSTTEICDHCGLTAPEGQKVHGACVFDRMYERDLEAARKKTDKQLKAQARSETPKYWLLARAARRVLNERAIWRLSGEART